MPSLKYLIIKNFKLFKFKYLEEHWISVVEVNVACPVFVHLFDQKSNNAFSQHFSNFENHRVVLEHFSRQIQRNVFWVNNANQKSEIPRQ